MLHDNRSTNKWAPGGQQKRFALYTFGVCAIIFAINISVLAVVWMLSRYPAASIEAIVEKVRAIFWLQGILLAVAAVVLSFWVVRDLAVPLPVLVIAEMMGVPESERPHIRMLAEKLLNIGRHVVSREP